ncbi:hypothetical protein ACTHGU_04655 [Chitinophagaceae bacterium MMS25-I14]
MINESVGFFPMPHTGIPQSIRFGCLNIYFLTEIWIVSLVSLGLTSNVIWKNIVKVCLAIFSIFWMFLFVKGGLTGLLIPAVLTGDILGAAIFLGIIINMMGTKDILKQPILWISLGYIIFYCCNIPYFGMLHYVYKIDEQLLIKLRMLLFLIICLRYLLTAFSFYLLKKQQTATPALNV